MKLSHFLLAAGLCSFSAASAQTTPSQSTPSQTPRGTGTAAPSAVPSGTAAPAADPKGNVSAGEVFTAGSPDANKTSTKSGKQKASMSSGSGKMKTKMQVAAAPTFYKKPHQHAADGASLVLRQLPLNSLSICFNSLISNR